MFNKFFFSSKNSDVVKNHDFLDKIEHILFLGDSHSKKTYGPILERKVSNRTRSIVAAAKSQDNCGQDTQKDATNEQCPNQDVCDESISNANNGEANNTLNNSFSGEASDTSNNSTVEDPEYLPENELNDRLVRVSEVIQIFTNDTDLLANADRDHRSNDQLMRESGLLSKALGANFQDIRGGSSSSFLRKRKSAREEYVVAANDEFNQELRDHPHRMLCAHWDGALVKNSTGGLLDAIDRFPIVISGLPTTHLLQIDKLTEGTGTKQAFSLLKALTVANILDRVHAFSYDTTASNTGRLNGTISVFEKETHKIKLGFPCLHHVFERVADAAVQKVYGNTTGPSDADNNEFASYYSSIRDDDISPLSDDDLSKIPKNLLERAIIELKHLEHSELRGDYKECVELSLLALGHGSAILKACGATSHARWLGHLIYAIKKFLLKDSLWLNEDQINNCKRLTIFTAIIYIRYFVLANYLFDAPINILNLYKDLSDYELVDPELAIAAKTRLTLHLEYLDYETIWLSFFSEKLTIKQKKEMQLKLNERTDEKWDFENRAKNLSRKAKTVIINKKKQKILPIDLNSYDLKMLLNENCDKISTYFGFDLKQTSFADREYFLMRDRLIDLEAVNDKAERAIKLAKDFNQFGTRNEDEKQKLFLTVDRSRKKFKGRTKEILAAELKV